MNFFAEAINCYPYIDLLSVSYYLIEEDVSSDIL